MQNSRGFETYAPPASGCFPNLKSLDVGVHCPGKSLMEKLFTNCPALEYLTIEGLLMKHVSFMSRHDVLRIILWMQDPSSMPILFSGTIILQQA